MSVCHSGPTTPASRFKYPTPDKINDKIAHTQTIALCRLGTFNSVSLIWGIKKGCSSHLTSTLDNGFESKVFKHKQEIDSLFFVNFDSFWKRANVPRCNNILLPQNPVNKYPFIFS